MIVATYRRPGQLAECLDSLAALDYPTHLLEVIVVDDGGGVDLDASVRKVRRLLELELVETEHAGQSHARNIGAQRARGELLAFIDDDCRAEVAWLRLLAERYVAQPGSALGGHTVNGLTSNPYSAASQLVLDVLYRRSNEADGARFFTTNNLVVPREGFLAVGGLAPSFRAAEDREFCDRWLRSGRRLTYVPDAVVRHFHHHTFATFCRQHFRYGRGAFRYHRTVTERTGRRSRIGPAFHVDLMLREPWRVRSGADSVRLAALLQIWNLANTAGFVWEWARSR